MAWQLKETGIGDAGAYRRAKRGTLHRVYTGVYRVGHDSPSLPSDLLAAVMAAGPWSAVSHLAAARLWELVDDHGATIDVATRGNRRTRPGLRVHRFPSLCRADLRGRERIPLTAPALTVLDLAASQSPAALEAVLDEARFKRLITDRDLSRLRERHPRRAGWGPLAALLEAEGEPGYSRSEAERRLLDLIRSAGLPLPRRNVPVAGYRVDLLWPEHGLVVEVDGYASHGRRRNFERDRARDADLAGGGIQARRFTWNQITRRQLWVAARLGAALARAQESTPTRSRKAI